MEIAERLCLNQICKQLIFSKSHLLVQRLLRGLENKNSVIRSSILKGFSQIIVNEPTFLYHPLLVPHLTMAFSDPTPAVREAVLEIVTEYITQNEQMHSPYFAVVLTALSDKSPLVVKAALKAVGVLGKQASDEELGQLCAFLTKKLEDPSEKIQIVAKQTFLLSVFEHAKCPVDVLIKTVGAARPTWFPIVFKDGYLTYSEQCKCLIVELVDRVCTQGDYFNAALLREFCELLPVVCCEHYSRLISFFITSKDPKIMLHLPSALSALVKRVANPNLSLFGLMLQPMETLICSQQAAVVRAVIELCGNVVRYILTDNDILDSLQSQFCTFLRQNLGSVNKLGDDTNLAKLVCRGLYVSGCIYRFYGSKNRLFGNSLWGPVNHFFKCPVQKVRTVVLDCACDMCARDPRFIENAKGLVSAAFQLGPPESVSAVRFLAKLMEEESKGDDTIAIDEIRPLYSTALLKDFLKPISEAFSSTCVELRTESLKLARIAVAYGMINPHEILPHVIALMCAEEQCDDALVAIREAIDSFSFAGVVRSRLGDGLKQAFAFVQCIYPGGLVNVPPNHPCFGVAQIYTVLPSAMQRDLMNIIVNKLGDSLDHANDPEWVIWLVRVACGLQFSTTSEPAYLVKQLGSGSIYGSLKMVAKDSKDVLYTLGRKQPIPANSTSPKCWFAAVLIAKMKQWISKRYQIDLKKMDKALKDGKPVKVMKMEPLDLTAVPLPDKRRLTEQTVDLAACLMSAMRMERTMDPKSDAVEST
jgi:hypothetical protein